MNYGYEDYYYANLKPEDRERLETIAQNFNITNGHYPMAVVSPLNIYNATSPGMLRNIANGIMRARMSGTISTDEHGYMPNYNYNYRY